MLALIASLPVAGLMTVAAPAAQAETASERAEQPAAERPHRNTQPLVVAHRGASGYRPEHTLAAYRLAIQMGADFIEPDLVSTKDGVLVARHENEISGTTDVDERPEFAGRERTKVIDGREVTGWFTEDFTLAELKTLRAEERLPEVRPESAEYDGRFEVPTFTEVIELVRDVEASTGREIGIAPETKHPTYFDSIGLSMEETIDGTLEEYRLDSPTAKVILQSFEVGNLRDLDEMTKVDIAQLVSGSGAPYDKQAAGSPTTYDDMVTRAGLKRMSRYADWVAPTKTRVLPIDPETGETTEPTSLVRNAHRSGMKVVVWTLRAENRFMATNFRRGSDPNSFGDLHAETTAFLDAGVDAVFSDHPDIADDARDDWSPERNRG